MSQNARVGKSSPVIGQVNVARITLRNQDIADVQAAINSARSIENPRRKALYELYENLALDGHFHAVLNKRTINVANKRITWVQDGASDALMKSIHEDILDTPWFYDFITGSMQVVPYGPTLLELIPEAGLISRCEVVPRANVVPEFGHISKDASNTTTPWIMYREDPKYTPYLIEVGRPRDLGAMMIALPYILYKRGTFGDWAQFVELFGQPFRVGKYNPWDESTRSKLMTALAEMGGAGYAVIPDGTSLEFHNPASSQGQSAIFKDMVSACNAELSKIFLGNTLTTEQGENGARSLGDVHQGVEADIALADMKRIEFLLNWELKDRLMRLGYPVKDGRFAFDVTVGLPLEKRIEVDKKVAEQVDVPESYWYDTYGIPMPTAAERIKLDKAKEDAPKADPATPKKEEEGEADDEVDRADTASMQKAIDRLYRAHGHTHGFTAAGGPDEDSDGIMDELARAFHDGRITGDHVDPKLMQWTADQLFKGVMGGMDLDDGAGPQSEQLQAFMRDNVFTFSGFKSYQVAKAVSAELMDEDGQFRSFVDFKKRVLAIDETYNKNYLRSEYEHAVASGQMAQRWTDLQADRDLFPFLRYSTVGDDRVRDEHEGYDGITEHIDHPFWDTNYPPNGWRCRCDVEQVARLGGGRSLPANWEPVRKGMFASNVGKDGVVFPKDHPYSSKAPKAVKAKVEKLVQDVLGDEGAAITNRAQGTPVSGSLTTDNKALSTVLTRTMKAIDSVHGDGVLSAIPLKPTRAKAFGFYRSTFYNAVDIGVRLTGDHQHLTLAHEVGHWLDHIGLGQGVSWGTSSIASAEMKAVQAAMAQSKVIKGINEVLNTGIVKDTAGNDVRLPLRLRKYYTYLANPKEQWARAYSQYVAVRSGDEALLKDLKTVRSSGIPTQWTAKDFAPIAKAIDLLFIAKGWRTK